MEGTLDNTPRQTVMFFVAFIGHADINTHTYSAIGRLVGEHGLVKSALEEEMQIEDRLSSF